MKNKELINILYLQDGIRDAKILKQLLNDEVVLEWISSDGVLIFKKDDIITLANELKANYKKSIIEITHQVEEGNQIAIKYDHKVSTIENPDEIMLIAKFFVIWEFKENKLFKGSQISQPV